LRKLQASEAVAIGIKIALRDNGNSQHQLMQPSLRRL
jgi:hypothetical protein